MTQRSSLAAGVLALLASAALAGCAQTSAQRPITTVPSVEAEFSNDAPRKPAVKPATWAQVQALKQPPAGTVIQYGAHPDQFGELFLPRAPDVAEQADGVPVVVLIHGGCWLQDYDAQYMRPLAAALAGRGFAVWNIEYRRVSGLKSGDGGFPETFDDVGLAIDLLAQLAAQENLDMSRLAAVGHSAGGHLALWSATRDGQGSGLAPPLSGQPVRPGRVVGLAAIADLASYRVGPPNSCHAAVDTLVGGTDQAYPERYALVSPAQRSLGDAAAVLINGTEDPIVPLDGVRTYAESRPQVDVVALDGLGHFDVVMPAGPAFEALTTALDPAISEPPPR